MFIRFQPALLAAVVCSFCLVDGSTANHAQAVEKARSEKTRGFIIDFSATWCGPCQQMAPLVERLHRQGYPIKSVDVDQRRDLASKYRVDRLPTFILFIDGKEQQRHVGRLSEAELQQMLARIPANAPTQPRSRGGDLASRQPEGIPKPRSRSPLLDLIPGRKKAAPPSLDGAVVRANADDRVPDLRVATGPMASSVRIRVKADGQMNFGSGTIVESMPGRAIVATCWHIFRGANRETKIEVDTFFTGQTQTHTAKLIRADEKADVGLIEVSTDSNWPAVRVASTARAPSSNDAVVSIGCGGGQDPTRQSIRVLEIDRYNGPSNIECSGLPIRGRSGGGLFNARGELIGICSAANKEENRGLYAGLFAIHDLLDQTQLAHLYRDTMNNIALADRAEPRGPENLALETTGDAVSLGGEFGGNAFEFDQPAAPSQPSPDAFLGMTAAPGASSPTTGDDVEIVCVIRSKSDPALGSRVIVIDDSDPKLLELIRQYERQSRQ